MKQIVGFGIVVFSILSSAGVVFGDEGSINYHNCGNTGQDPTRTVDMRKPGQSMHGIPNLDQDGMTLCQTYSGITMVTAWINKHSPGLSVEERRNLTLSPFMQWIVSQLNQADSCKSQAPCNMVNLVKRFGGCYAKDVLYNKAGTSTWLDAPEITMGKCVRWERKGNLESGLQFVVDVLNEALSNEPTGEMYRTVLRDAYKRFFAAQGGRISGAYQMVIIDQALGGFGHIASAALGIFAPMCSGIKFFAGVPGVYFRPQVDLRKFPEFSCYENIPFADPGCEFLTPEMLTAQQYIDNLNRELDREKPLPPSIHFCWPFLLDGPRARPEKQGQNGCFRAGKENREGADQEVDHKVNILGRRWNAGSNKCEYLMRNHWGNDCNSYYSNGKKDSYDLKASCEKELVENGHADIWVPAEWLAENMHGFSYLQ